MPEQKLVLQDKEKETFLALRKKSEELLRDIGDLTIEFELKKATGIKAAMDQDRAFRSFASKIMVRNAIDPESPHLKYGFDEDGTLIVATPDEAMPAAKANDPGLPTEAQEQPVGFHPTIVPGGKE